MNFSKEIISTIDQKDIFKIALTNDNNFQFPSLITEVTFIVY